MILESPLNLLSIGNVGFNFARELWRLKQFNGFFATADNYDWTSYEPVEEEFKSFLDAQREVSLQNLSRGDQVLKVWHLNDSQRKLTDNQYLYTFYEVDSPTSEEVAIVNLQNHVFFSSQESADCFKAEGCENVSYVPLGFDEDFRRDVPVRKNPDKVHFILVGKLEQRKNTQRIIELWLEKYGNNNDYQLTCVVNNPFFKPEFQDQIIANTLKGQSWSNINFLPHLKTNLEMAALHKSADIDLSGLSNGEGWGLPAFNSTCLGLWSVVSDCSGHKGWATADNSVLVPISGKQPCYDGIFFNEGGQFNQGSYYRIEDDAIFEGMERAVAKVADTNMAGLKLGEELTYANTINQILNVATD